MSSPCAPENACTPSCWQASPRTPRSWPWRTAAWGFACVEPIPPEKTPLAAAAHGANHLRGQCVRLCALKPGDLPPSWMGGGAIRRTRCCNATPCTPGRSPSQAPFRRVEREYGSGQCSFRHRARSQRRASGPPHAGWRGASRACGHPGHHDRATRREQGLRERCGGNSGALRFRADGPEPDRTTPALREPAGTCRMRRPCGFREGGSATPKRDRCRRLPRPSGHGNPASGLEWHGLFRIVATIHGFYRGACFGAVAPARPRRSATRRPTSMPNSSTKAMPPLTARAMAGPPTAGDSSP